MHQILRYESTDSTNLRLKELADGADNGLVALAAEQTLGRGRLSRSWLSRKGEGAWFSILVKDARLTNENAAGLVFVCAMAGARSLKRLSGADVGIKWPNDLVRNGKKLAGILCESGFEGQRLKWTVCGVGINLTTLVFPGELPWAGSVLSETGVALEADVVVDAFLEEFDSALETLLTEGLAAVISAVKPLSATLGRRVMAEYEGGTVSGEAIDLLPDGALLLKTEDALVPLRVGDVSVRGLMGYT